MYVDEPMRWLDHISGDFQDLKAQIREGEHQSQDFKFRIDSAQKIAITLCAFANTQGGKLLIGVKDNGKISGIDPEEEYYMIEGAAKLYCKSAVEFTTKVYENDQQKKVLEVSVLKSNNKPHFAKNKEGKWQAYIRQDDENFAVNRVILQYLKHNKARTTKKNMVAYGEEERALFDLLSLESEISISKYSRKAKIPLWKAEKILVLFLQWGVIQFRATENGIRFYLAENTNP